MGALPVARVLAVAGASASLYGCGKDDPTTAAPAAPYEPKTVQAAWDNHFAAFAQANDAGLDQIMLDYTDDSILTVFNDNCDGQADGATKNQGFTAFEGKTAIRGLFSGLFGQLKNNIGADGSNVVPTGAKVENGAGTPSVTEPSGNIAAANVFLTWTADKASPVIDWATDTFSWKKEGELMRIHKQNIVVKDATACAASKVVKGTDETAVADLTSLNTCAAETTGLCGAWNNHLGAFSANRLEADQGDATLPWIMADYNEDSVVQVFDARTKTVAGVHKGTAAIKQMFTDLFADLNVGGVANAGLGIKLLEVDSRTNTVFLVWVSDGVPQATDTFIFDDTAPNPKIITQNIQIVSKARQQMVV